MTDDWAGILGPAEREAVCARHRRLGRPGAGRRRRPGGGGPPGGGRPGHRRTPLVPAAAGGREGVRHRLADAPPAHPPPRVPSSCPAPRPTSRRPGEYLLTRNADLLGMASPSGDEDAVYLVGRVPVARVDDDELDRIIGASLAYTDECFPTAMALGLRGPLPPPAAVAALTAPRRPAGPLVAFGHGTQTPPGRRRKDGLRPAHWPGGRRLGPRRRPGRERHGPGPAGPAGRGPPRPDGRRRRRSRPTTSLLAVKPDVAEAVLRTLGAIGTPPGAVDRGRHLVGPARGGAAPRVGGGPGHAQHPVAGRGRGGRPVGRHRGHRRRPRLGRGDPGVGGHGGPGSRAPARRRDRRSRARARPTSSWWPRP